MDPITMTLLAWITCTFGMIIFFICLRRYEVMLFLLIASPWISSVFILNSKDLEGDEVGPGSYIRTALLLLLGCAGAITYFLEQERDRTRVPLHLKLLGVFTLLSLLSTAYSIDQQYTFVRSLSLLAVFAVLMGCSKRLKNEQSLNHAMNVLFYFAGLFVALNLLSMVLWPDKVWFPNEGRFQGLATQPNELSWFFIITYPILAWKYAKSPFLKKLGITALILAAIVMHILTGSRGSIAVAIFGSVVWLILQKNIGRLVVFVALMVIPVSIISIAKPTSFQREGSGSITDLTGREEFWYGTMILIGEKPLLGYGYAVDGKVWVDPRFNRPEYGLWRGSAKTSLHNGYLSVLVGNGVPAFLLWCATLAIPLLRCLKLPYSDYKGFVISVMAMLLVLNFVESVIAASTPIGAVVFWPAWLIAGRLSELAKGREEIGFLTSLVLKDLRA